MSKTKKILLITVVAILLAASVIGVTYAAVKWDVKNQVLNITTDNTASNVIIKATVEANSADTTKLLIPMSIAKFPASNASNGVKIGKVQLALETDGIDTVAQLLARVKISFNVDKIEKIKSGATSEVTDWQKYFTVTLRTSDSYLSDNSNVVKDITQVTNPYYVFLEFKNLAAVSDATEKATILDFQGAEFKVHMTVKIANKV